MKRLSLFIGLMIMLLPVSVEAKTKYVVLGDSISLGYGLEEETEGFSHSVAEELGYDCEKEVVMAAQNGATTSDLLDLFASKPKNSSLASTVKKALKEAEVVTITIGGNDLLGVLYGLILEEIGEEDLDITTLQGDIQAGNASYLMAMLNVINDNASENEKVDETIDTYKTNLEEIIDKIKEINPDVRIILTTQYNPYYAFENSESLKNIHKEFDDAIVKLNDVIESVGKDKEIEIIDVYTHFDRHEDPASLLNATMQPTNLDFHPNAAGHEVIAYALNGGELPEAPEAESAEEEKASNLVTYLVIGAGVLVVCVGAGLIIKSKRK